MADRHDEAHDPTRAPTHDTHDPAWRGFGGTGPGERSRDGCSVELYRRTPYAGEIEPLAPWLAIGTTVLELGCGTGRLTQRLLDYCCVVTAVDNSADMLAHVPLGAQRVCSDIETLRLPERFDLVLLPSGLINHADAGVRHAFLRAAAAHLKPGGQLLLKCQDARWLREAAVGTRSRQGDLALEVTAVERQGDAVSMTLRYQLDTEGAGGAAEIDTWTHRFHVVALDEPAIEALLAETGFAAPGWIDDERLWLAATPRAGAR